MMQHFEVYLISHLHPVHRFPDQFSMEKKSSFVAFFSAANVFGRQSSFLWWSKCKIGIVGWKLIRGRRHKNEMKTSQKILLDLIQLSGSHISKSFQLNNYSNPLRLVRTLYCDLRSTEFVEI